MFKRALRKLVAPWLWSHTSAEYQCGRLSYSQFGEDIICGFFFSNGYKGVHVDVGAFHPMLLSNTYDFYRRGWRGLCIDANPEVGALFARFRPEDKFIHTAVGREAGTIELAMFKESAFNCLSEHLDDVPDEVRKTAALVKVPILPLSSILEENKVKEVDFLSVDCEGNDLDVLRSNDWSRWRPKVVCVEDHAADWQHSEVVDFLSSVGYTLKYRAIFSSIFIPDEIAARQATSRGLEPVV